MGTSQRFSPAALERHLQGITEKLRSGVNGKVREAIQQSVARMLVGADGTITVETKPEGLLGVERNLTQSKLGETPAGFEPKVLSAAGRQWRLTTVELSAGGAVLVK